MTNKKTLKVFALVFAVVLMIAGAVGVYVGAESATEEVTISIYKKNVSFQASPRLAFAVDHSGCEATDVKLHVWYGSKSGAPTEYIAEYTSNIDGTEYPVFYIDAKDPKDVFLITPGEDSSTTEEMVQNMPNGTWQ